MPKLAIGHVEQNSVFDLCPVGVMRQEHKLRVPINELFDKPGARYAVHFNSLAGDPFHDLAPCFVMQSLLNSVTRPSRNWQMREASMSASPRSCVTYINVNPNWFWRSSKSEAMLRLRSS